MRTHHHIALLALVALTGCVAQQYRQPINMPATAPQTAKPAVAVDETDRFTGSRTVKYQTFKPWDISVSTFAFIGKGVSASKVNRTVILSMSNDGWKYLKCNSTYWLADGKPVATVSQKHSGTVLKRRVAEHIITEFSPENFRILSSASVVEYKICNDERSVSSDEIDGMRQVERILQTP